VKLASTLLALGFLFSIAAAQSHDKTIQAQAAPTSARVALEQMSQAERKNSCISVEFETADRDAILLGHEVERLWNGGQFDEALTQLGNLEARVGHVAIGNSWRKPVPTIDKALWGGDVRIGNRDSLLSLAFDIDRLTGHVFAVLRHGSGYPHFTVCMSTDSGATWAETFSWSGSPPTSLDAAVLANRLYVVYNSPGEDPEHIRLRRFLCSNGQADSFQGGGTNVVPCTLSVGDTMKEVALATNPNDNRLHIIAIVSDGSVLASVADANAVSWTTQLTGITSGARSGLDATDDQWSDDEHVVFSYCDASDTMRVYDGNGPLLAQPAGSGALTSISAYLDTIICVYEDETSSPYRVGCATSVDGGDTWTVSTLSDTGMAANAPAVTVRGGVAALFRQDSTTAGISPTPGLRFRQHTDSGPWSDPVSVADHEPYSNRPGIAYLGAGMFGVAYLSDTSPVVRGAYFDRSDWVYGIEELPSVDWRMTNSAATIFRGVLVLGAVGSRQQTVDRAELLDAAGRRVMNLRAGANDVSRLAPGVYFVRAASREPSAVSCYKVVVTR